MNHSEEIFGRYRFCGKAGANIAAGGYQVLDGTLQKEVLGADTSYKCHK